MAIASLNIDKIIFCTLEVEGTNVPPSVDMIESILIMDGFGIAVPSMRMNLYDSDDILSRKLNLQNGTKVNIRLGKDSTTAPEYSFRVFGWGRPRASSGRILQIACVLDCPKYSAGAYSEVFSGNSSDVMAQVAQTCGLTYDAPRVTPTDSMNWMNFNATRLSFTEDVAVHGYASDQSCMYRMLRADGVLTYKDLIDVVKQNPLYSFCHNTDKGNTSTIYDVRIVKDASTSGVFTYFMNYGTKRHGHDYKNTNFSLKSLTLDTQGGTIPVNTDISGQIDNQSRVEYSGYDPGTGSEDGNNVHPFYQTAFYQNRRLMNLFSERLITISDVFTDTNIFTTCEFVEGPGAQQGAVATHDVAGTYLIGGKTRVIKYGTKYSEAHYMYRPFVPSNVG